MITKIRVLIIDNTYQKEYIIDPQNNTISTKDIIKQIDPETINNIIRMISTWKEEYKSDSIIDGEEFYIEIITDIDTTTLHGKGSYPSNYANFKTLIGAL